MNLLCVLNHIPLSHPSFGIDTVATREGTLVRRRMFLLEMDFHELLRLEPIHTSLVTTFKGARVSSRIICQ